MTGLPNDTHPDAEAVLIEGLRQMTVARKLELMAGLNHMARTLAMNGLRQRFPDASESELKRRLAGLLLGEELAEKAYGPLPQTGDDPIE